MVDYEAFKGQLGKKGKFFTEESYNELVKLEEDIDYGEEFIEAYADYFNVMEKGKWSTRKYLAAMKFFLFTEQGLSIVDSYVKVFPERLQARLDRGETKTNMTGEASRFNSSSIVTEIRRVAGIGIQLSHRHLLLESLDVTAGLMRSARSEVVRQKAAETLIRELKPTEDTKIQLDIGMNMKDSLVDIRKATEELALAQLQSIEAGVAVQKMAEMAIIEAEVDE